MVFPPLKEVDHEGKTLLIPHVRYYDVNDKADSYSISISAQFKEKLHQAKAANFFFTKFDSIERQNN